MIILTEFEDGTFVVAFNYGGVITNEWSPRTHGDFMISLWMTQTGPDGRIVEWPQVTGWHRRLPEATPTQQCVCCCVA